MRAKPRGTDIVEETVSPSPLVTYYSFLVPVELNETEAHQQGCDDKSNDDPRGQGSRFVLEMLIEHCDKYRFYSSQSEKNAHVEAVRYCRLEGCQIEFDISPTHQYRKHEKVEVCRVQINHLDQIEEREEEYPHDVDEVPVQSEVFYRMIVALSVSPSDRIG